jgi:aryl-alcohol dehydrogenase-like predicted oxidoreductase
VEQIDLYQMHAWDAVTPLQETLRFLDDAVRSGKIAYYGLSNFLGWQLTKAVHLARANGFTAPVTLQPQYSLLAREIESDIVPACADASVGLLPWSPLAGGWLTGKYQRDADPTGPRAWARTRSAEWRRGNLATSRNGHGGSLTRSRR